MVDDTLGSETDEPNPEPPALAAQELADDAVRLDLAMWQTISGSDQVPEFLLYLERFPEGYRHLAYLQTQIGFKVKPDMPGLKGPEVQALYARGNGWLAGKGL